MNVTIKFGALFELYALKRNHLRKIISTRYPKSIPRKSTCGINSAKIAILSWFLWKKTREYLKVEPAFCNPGVEGKEDAQVQW